MQNKNELKPCGVSVRVLSGVLLFMLMLALRPAYAAPIDDAENWFNTLTTLEARFVQRASDGSHAEGTFYLRRPYRTRFEYDDPIPLTLITTEVWLHVDEEDRQEVTSYPVSETPLAAILAERVSLRGQDFPITGTSRDGVTTITIGNTGGELVLDFSEEPFELRRWKITDANGVTISVVFSNIIKGHDLPASLFVPTRYVDRN